MAEVGETANFEALASKKETQEQEKPLELPPAIIEKLDQETIKHGQDECCGFVIEVDGEMDVVPMKNTLVDNKSGKSHHAYVMDTDEIIRLHHLLEKSKGRMVALYHSHTNHDIAHFSGSDVANAQQGGYRDIPYIVIAAKDGKVTDRKAYTHNAPTNSFIESKVAPIPNTVRKVA